MKPDDQHFTNRELSWLEFNNRVLGEAVRPDVPLLERLKFLCIVASNLDEFYMVRVASVKRQVREGDHVSCPSGIQPSKLMARIHDTIGRMTARAHEAFSREIMPELEKSGIVIHRPETYSVDQRRILEDLFNDEILPVLTPVRVSSDDEFPYTANLRLHAAFLVQAKPDTAALSSGDGGPALAIVQIPSSLNRMVNLPDTADRRAFALLEDLVVEMGGKLFPGYTVLERCLFRVTRDADLGVDEERDEDFVDAMRDVISSREHSLPVRVTVSGESGRLLQTLAEQLGIPENEVFTQTTPLDLSGFMALTGIAGFDHLRYRAWKPTDTSLLPEDKSIWEVLAKRDVLLHHPYEKFDPVVRLLRDAATDPAVLSIKITLYRTSGDSPIVHALEQAARNGKQVTAVVELKARFDEQRNIGWASRLERAGVIVVYGIARLKIHAKALLVVRRGPAGLTRFAHFGTGNYNDKTARLYTDFGLLTSRNELVYELGLFFNAITGYSAIPSLKKLAMSPVGLKHRVLQLIEREKLRAESGEKAVVLGKLNSLADPDVILALYGASQAGVEISLNIRGICMLRPGVEGLSENIEVVSVVDRYLEHARAFYFENGGSPEVFCSSADWMPRNLERRVELLFPVEDFEARARIVDSLEAAFKDNRHSHRTGPDGTSVRVDDGKTPFESQLTLQQAAEARNTQTHDVDRSAFNVRRKPPEA